METYYENRHESHIEKIRSRVEFMKKIMINIDKDLKISNYQGKHVEL